MRSTPRGAKLVALLACTALVAAACGSDSGGSSDTTAAPATEAPGSEAPSSEAPSSEAPAGDAAMTITYKLNPDAVWDDGTPITSKDFECTWKAALNTPGSIRTEGYDKITAVDTSDPQTVVVSFSEPYAGYKDLFGPGKSTAILKADYFANCDDVSADLLDSIPFSGRPWKQESWSPDQTVLVPNENYWVEEDKPIATRVVMVPKADSDTEINSLKSGEVGMIFPQAFAGITEALNDPNIQYTPGYGANYEGLYFQQLNGPFADPIFREAFSKSVDRELILKSIYDPIFPGSQLLQCGLWVPTVGKWCDDTQFEGSYDPAAAEALLTENGWAKDGSGFWAKDGVAPTIRWMVNTGNKRREDAQALMIPDFAAKGFNVVADNADADTVFQKRLPALDYDLAMYIFTASPDPTVTAIMDCAQIPSPENNNQGQNQTGYCNEEASAIMQASDAEIDETKRIELIHQIGQFLVDDHVNLPLFQFPNIAAWRTDKLTGPIDEWAGNTMSAFKNLNKWEPVDGTEVLIGAEQWPDCLNPITECSNSSWMFWTATVPLLPGVYDTTADGYEITSLVTEEPTVELA